MFDVSGVIENERLHAAELMLNRVALEDLDEAKLVRISVHDIVRPGVKGKTKPVLRLIDSKILDIRSNETVSLDVHPAVERWLSKIPGESANHGLLVRVRFF